MLIWSFIYSKVFSEYSFLFLSKTIFLSHRSVFRALSQIYDDVLLDEIVNGFKSFLQKKLLQMFARVMITSHFVITVFHKTGSSSTFYGHSLFILPENISNSVYWEIWNKNNSQFNLLCLFTENLQFRFMPPISGYSLKEVEENLLKETWKQWKTIPIIHFNLIYEIITFMMHFSRIYLFLLHSKF